MLSNLCELAGMASLTAATYLAAGDAAALAVGGVFAVIVGLALDGVKVPHRKRTQQ